MNNDRELLEQAAKAAGMYHPDGFDWLENELGFQWNPLTDDGDALRLAVKLGISVKPFTKLPYIWADHPAADEIIEETIVDDPHAATRRAIVRAAAEIGKGMK